jgi:hypothetical protein
MRSKARFPEFFEDNERHSTQAFLDALHSYPIDNRREYECFRDTFTRGETGLPNPPRRPDAPFRLGSRQAVIDAAIDQLERDYPRQLAVYTVIKAALVIAERLDAMETVRVSGLKAQTAGGTRAALGWNLG